MASKAAKRRKRVNRGGRPRKPGKREPSGRPSRKIDDVAARDLEALAPVLETRSRLTGIPVDRLLDHNHLGAPNAGTAHGILCLKGTISERQWQTAEYYLQARAAWLRAIDAPGNPIDPPEELRVAGDPEAIARWAEAARASWHRIMARLQLASTLHREPVIAAFDVILVRNRILDHLVSALRVGLDEL